MRQKSLITDLVLQISIVTGCIVCCAAVFTGILLYFRSEKSIQKILHDSAITIIRDHIVISRDSIVASNAPSGQTLASTLREHDVSLVVYSPDFTRIGTYGIYRDMIDTQHIDIFIPRNRFDSILQSKKPLYTDVIIGNIVYDTYSVPLLLDGTPVGLLQVSREATIVKLITDTIPLVLITIVPITSIITALLIWVMAKKKLSPLSGLVERVRDIDIDQGSDEIPVIGQSKEIAILTDAFNTLVHRVRKTVLFHKQFTQTASHELKAPLARSVSSIDVAITESGLSDSVKQIMMAIRNDLLKLSGTVDSVLTIPSGRDTRLAVCTIAQTVDVLVSRMKKDIEEKRLTVQNHTQGQFYSRIPNEHIEIIITNILSNAVKYTPFGGTIFIRGSYDNSVYVWAVADTGIGISKEDLKGLFSRRTRGNQVGNIPGFGIGLSTVKTICDRYGIRINVSSAPKGGTTVTLLIPGLPMGNNTAINHQ